MKIKNIIIDSCLTPELDINFCCFLTRPSKVYLDLLRSVGRILGAVTETIFSVVATKIQIIQALSSSGVVAGVVEGAAKGGAVLAQEGSGLLSAGVNLAKELIKVGENDQY